MENINTPLVSIIIITYNSAEFVCETLQSAWRQTYRNIEIIVSDDCSSDNTIEKCKLWISEHKGSNIRIELLTTANNTGTAGNCNRGLSIAKGEWIKFIAGDDLLAPNAIKDYVTYVNSHSKVNHLVAKEVPFKGRINTTILTQDKEQSMFLFNDAFTAKKQYNVITKMLFGSGPTYFVNAHILREIGGFDERFPLQEDYPLFIKMIGQGHKMEFLDKVTVYYRVSETSVSHSKESFAIFTKNQIRVIVDYKFQYRKESLNSLWKLLHHYSLALQNLIISLGNTKKNPLCVILKLFYSLTDPFVWFARYIIFKERRYLRTNKG